MSCFRPGISFCLLVALIGGVLSSLAAAQDDPDAPASGEPWTQEELLERSRGFLQSGISAELQQIASLVVAGADARPALAGAIQGDHREYTLKVAGYLDQLADPRWQAREEAERVLIEIGARNIGQIEQRAGDGTTLEERLRARRIVDAIEMRGTSEERDRLRVLRGLTQAALYVEGGADLVTALRSALGHSDAGIVGAALLALGKHGGDTGLQLLAARLRGAESELFGGQREAALSGLGIAPGAAARELATELLLTPGTLPRGDAVALLADLRSLVSVGLEPIPEALSGAADEVVRALAAVELPAEPLQGLRATFQLADRTELRGELRTLTGRFVAVADAVPGLPLAFLDRSRCQGFALDHEPQPVTGVRVFLKQGSRLVGELVAMDDAEVTVRTRLFGERKLPRSAVQGIAIDPQLDRLIGASVDHDRIRTQEGELIDGTVLAVEGGVLRYAPAASDQDNAGADTAEPVELGLDRVAGLLLRRPRASGGSVDERTYTRIELVTGSRLLADVGGARGDRVAVHVEGLGAVAAPLELIQSVEFGVGGGAMWGFTLIADYSDNRVYELDDQGNEVFALEDIYGPFDVECLDNGNLLITEFALSRIVEKTRSGEDVWEFPIPGAENPVSLRNPYDADVLPNGNVLIADTFGSRVLEVNRAGEVVWQFAGVDPYDVERLPNGNTLIADEGTAHRAIEVDPNGEIVWEVPKLPGIHDVDRLSNGNTLITLRGDHRVIEVDRDGKVVFEILELRSPSDADRLPNGHTIVAENGSVREFDRNGGLVQERDVAWAVEVNRY